MLLLRGVPAVLGLVSLTLCAAAQTPQPSDQFPDVPTNLKPYYIALYVNGANAGEPQSKEEHDALLRKHLAYIRSQVEAGKYALVGPLRDEDRVRGIAIIRAASAEEARQIANGDPEIQAGRMAIEVHPGVLPDLDCVRVEYQSAPRR